MMNHAVCDAEFTSHHWDTTRTRLPIKMLLVALTVTHSLDESQRTVIRISLSARLASAAVRLTKTKKCHDGAGRNC